VFNPLFPFRPPLPIIHRPHPDFSSEAEFRTLLIVPLLVFDVVVIPQGLVHGAASTFSVFAGQSISLSRS
jgi:hypothetical protein